MLFICYLKLLKLKHIKFTVYALTLALFFGCNSSNIKNGDIVFRGVSNSELSEAINDVTQTSKRSNYTHMGVCEVENNTVYVYHADSKKGVIKEPLNKFCKTKETNYTVDVYRIKNATNTQIEIALKQAKKLIGTPYNTTYILEDEGVYCSEYIYEIYKTDSIFKLEPMTFKNPKTNAFHDGWIKHYAALGIEIPEGKLGCNPNGMANSNELKFIKSIQKTLTH